MRHNFKQNQLKIVTVLLDMNIGGNIACCFLIHFKDSDEWGISNDKLKTFT